MDNESKEFFKAILYVGVLPAIVLLSLMVGLDNSGAFISDNQWSDAVEVKAHNLISSVIMKMGAESYKCFTEPPRLEKGNSYTGQCYCYSKKEGIFLESSLTYTVERSNDLEDIELELVKDATTINGYTRIK
jgi:hypothetical protein